MLSWAKPSRQDTMSCGLKFIGKEGPDLTVKGLLCVGEIITQIKVKQFVSLTVDEIFCSNTPKMYCVTQGLSSLLPYLFNQHTQQLQPCFKALPPLRFHP